MLIKRAALGNLKTSFHCTHWHRFFPLKKAFSKTYPSFLTLKEGSTSHLGLLSSGEKKETALLGARNRYAIRLADHQRSSPCYAGWDRLGMNYYGKATSQLQRRHCSIPSLLKSLVVSFYLSIYSIFIRIPYKSYNCHTCSNCQLSMSFLQTYISRVLTMTCAVIIAKFCQVL